MGVIHAVDVFKNSIRRSQITLGIVWNGITVYENADEQNLISSVYAVSQKGGTVVRVPRK